MSRPRRRGLAARGLGLGLAAVWLGLLFPDAAHASPLGSLKDPFRQALESGSFGMALGLVFLAGLATALTPCVYPMIVITVSVFGARQARSRLEGAMLSTAFVLGIAALFTPLGVIVALTGGVFGGALASPWVLGGLALLFTLLALSMFGAFEMNLPASMQNRLAQVGGSGPRGAFALGFVNGIIAAPCTGPVLAVLLTWVGTSGSVAFGGLSLFVYALGLGALFWVVGTFAITLPKSGKWLEGVKSAFGVVMLVMALYYIRDLLPFDLPAQRSTPWIALAPGAAVVGIALGAVHLSFHDPSRWIRTRKTLGIALAVGGLFASVGWLEALPPGAKIDWMKDYDRAKQVAEKEQRPLLVDFGASWCGACGELDRQTFSDPRVVSEAKDFVPVKIDLSPDTETPEKWALLRERYDQPGLPLVVLHDRKGKVSRRITQFVEPDKFLEIMQRVE